MWTCSCGSFVRGSGGCPSCGASASAPVRRIRSEAALLLGLTLGGCPLVAEPKYGVAATADTAEVDADTDADTDAETGDTGE